MADMRIYATVNDGAPSDAPRRARARGQILIEQLAYQPAHA
jgi:hypothetical protein